MARDQGASGARGLAANWVAHRPNVRFPSDLQRERMTPIPFRHHDKEELGRVVLSEMAKHTGLRPDDLHLAGDSGNEVQNAATT